MADEEEQSSSGIIGETEPDLPSTVCGTIVQLLEGERRIPIPAGLKDLLHDLTIKTLQSQPENVYDFLAAFMEARCNLNREQIKQIIEAEETDAIVPEAVQEAFGRESQLLLLQEEELQEELSSKEEESRKMANRIVIFMSSVRPGRVAERVTLAVKSIVSAQGLEPIIFDPAELPLEVVKVPLHFMRDPEKEAPEWMLKANKTIQEAHGFIIISAEYNCGIPPALSNMLDHFPPASFRHRPCGIVSYSPGSFGGCRVPLVLRPFISELGMLSTPFAVSIPSVNEAFEEDGKCTSERISNNLSKLVQEVGWFAEAIRKQQESLPLPQ